MNVDRPKTRYGILFLGILVAGSGIAASIVTFESPLMRMAGIAVCLCGVYLMRRSTNNDRIRKKYPVTRFDFWIYILFVIALSLTLIAGTSLFIFKNISDLVGSILVYSFMIFLLTASIIGSFLFARFISRSLQ